MHDMPAIYDQPPPVGYGMPPGSFYPQAPSSEFGSNENFMRTQDPR